MADDPHNQDTTPRGDDESPEASETPETSPDRGGLGRFASRFRRGRDPESETPLEDALELTATNPDDEIEPDVDLDRVPWSARPEFREHLESRLQPVDEVELEAEPGPESDLAPEFEREPSASPVEVPSEADEAPPAPAPDDEPAATVSELAVPTAPVLPAPEPMPSLAPQLRAPSEDEDDEERPRVGPRTRPAGISAHLVVLTGIATAVILAFLLIEPSPRWLLLLGSTAVVFGLDGTLRQTWRAPFSFGQETAPFLFAPALYMLAVPVLIEHNVAGELALLVGLGAGLGFGGLAWAEIASVRAQAPEYEQARIIVTANTYLTGFAIFSLSYVFDVSLPAAIIATSIAAAMLAVEILREGEIDPMETLGLSLVTGIVIGEARWLLYYIPLDTYLAGLTLLLIFYLTTGLLHSHVIRALNRVVAFEYSGIAAAGLALVVIARAAGLA